MRTEIPLSKARLAIGIAGSIIFIILGYFLLTDDYERYTNALTRAVGVLSILFFGAVLLVSFFKLFAKKPGLVIDEDGITDNSGTTGTGLIEWKDITGIDIKAALSNSFIVIYVTNPDKYIRRAKGQKAWLMKRNMGLYGSPLSISSSALKYNFEELYRLIQLNIESHNGNRIA